MLFKESKSCRIDYRGEVTAQPFDTRRKIGCATRTVARRLLIPDHQADMFFGSLASTAFQKPIRTYVGCLRERLPRIRCNRLLGVKTDPTLGLDRNNNSPQ